jgi:selenocysteine-specific elongation factor
MKPAPQTPQQTPATATRSLVIGTAGHIDHGKTALVLALTGTDTDRLPEEKSRGITIDLGFAALHLKDAEGRSVDLSLVDVPGHHAFIHNMLAGAGGIEAVLLVVSADEGVKAQTAEHLAICDLLGVRHGIIALTKCDAVSAERLEQARNEVRNLTRHTFLEEAPLLVTSARAGEGIGDLTKALLHLALKLPEHSNEFITRLPLDRAFSVPGFGTVVTGTLLSGILRSSENVELQPAGRIVRVRGLQVHQHSHEEARAPTRVALNLAGIEVGEINRGDVIVPPGTLFPTDTVDVELRMLPGAPPLRHRAQAQMHAFTSEAMATVLLYEIDSQSEAVTRLARLRLSKPMLLVPGDHFVLRSSKEVLGGGRVVDAAPLPRLRKATARQWLQQVRNASPAQQIFARVQRRGTTGITLPELVQETGLSGDAILTITAPLIEQNRIVGIKTNRAHIDQFIEAEALSSAVALLFGELTRKPSHSSTRAELLSRTGLREWVFDLALDRLLRTKPVRFVGTQISIATVTPAPNIETELLAKIEGLYRSAGLASPIVSEVASALHMDIKNLTRLLTLLLRAGKLVRMGSDNLLVHTDALTQIKTDLAQRRGQTFDVGGFKNLTGLTRKHAIPLLEYLDGARVTLNRDGIRTVL